MMYDGRKALTPLRRSIDFTEEKVGMASRPLEPRDFYATSESTHEPISDLKAQNDIVRRRLYTMGMTVPGLVRVGENDTCVLPWHASAACDASGRDDSICVPGVRELTWGPCGWPVRALVAQEGVGCDLCQCAPCQCDKIAKGYAYEVRHIVVWLALTATH